LILKDRQSGSHKGCGFVTFAGRQQAEAAIEALNDKVKLPGAKRELILRIRPEGGEDKKAGTEEIKLYVGMLSRKSTEDDIRKLFDPYGDVTEVYLMRQKDQNAQSRGAAFVKFRTRDEALRAVQALNGRQRDKDAPGLLQVRFAQAKQDKTQDVSRLNPMMPFPNLYPGFAASAFPTPEGFPGAQMNPYVPFYPPTQQPTSSQGNDLRGPPGSNLFIYNIPDSYEDGDLASLFSNFGTVLSSKVQRDKSTNVSKGYGFVSFDNAKSASASIAAMDGFMIGNKRLNVRVKKGDETNQGVTIGNGTRGSSYQPY